MYKNKLILVITDNGILYSEIKQILLNEFPDIYPLFEFKRSKLGKMKKMYTAGIDELDEIDVKIECDTIIKKYQKVISLHCKQIFPPQLVENIQCINIHPGYNPYNRGWYPQVFAIINKQKIGATIHLMDRKVDHGPIIDRRQININAWDTSKEVYEKVLNAELELFRYNIGNIVNNTFDSILPEIEGQYHSIDDYREVCKIDLQEMLTMKQAIDRLRALSHGIYKNAYFFDEEGNKIFIKIELSKE